MDDFVSACKECKTVWLKERKLAVTLFPKVKEKQQIKNENGLTHMLKEIELDYKNQDLHMLDLHLHNWIEKDEIWNLSWLSPSEREDFYSISKQFMKDARKFDDKMKFEDIGQAIRNVWIVLMIEKVFNQPLRYHKAIFAYSMLYPYTDNYLDDEHISREDKSVFNKWLSKRLLGEVTTYERQEQKKVDALICLIEQEYPRLDYPEVYQSLLYIQDGQKKSVLQRDIKDYERLLEISIEKGGASVLADGYLIQGSLHKDEVRFCVAFGFMLQLADDIQDMKEDLVHQHHTLASTLYQKKQREQFCNAYFHFVRDVIYRFCPSKDYKLKAFIEENCRLLVLFSLLQHAAYYPRLYLYHVRKRIPLRTIFMEKLQSRRSPFISINESFMRQIDYYLQMES